MMPNELKEIDNELYFCRYLNKDNARYDSIVSGRFILVFTLSGKARFLLNDKAFDIDKSKFLLLHPHVESRIESLSDDFRACCIGSIMELQNSVTYNIPPTFLAMVLQRPVWAMDETTMRAAHAFCTLFDYNYSYVKGTNAANIAASLFSVFIQTFYEKTKNELPSEESETVSVIRRNLITRFMSELRLNYKVSHQVTYYAERVYVTPKYLTQVVRRALGLTPKELIDRKLTIESMYLLSKSEMSIQEISNELGFPGQSYFGRFFRRMLGLSPLEFRRNPDMSMMSRMKPVKHNDMWSKMIR
jgi:AraC-like DNA-binding protein